MSQTPVTTKGSAGRVVHDLTELDDSEDSSKKTSMGNRESLPMKSETHSFKSKSTKLRTVTRAEREEIAQGFSELDNKGMIQAAKLIKIGLHKAGKHGLADMADKALGAGDDIDLQLDEIPEESLHDLLRLVRRARRKKTTADVVVLDDDEVPPQIVSSPFQKSQSKGSAWPVPKRTALTTATPLATSLASPKSTPLSQTPHEHTPTMGSTLNPLSSRHLPHSPVPGGPTLAASTGSLPLSSIPKPQRHSLSSLKTEVSSSQKKDLKRKPGVDIHDLTGDVEVIDLDDELPAQPQRLSTHQRSAIQREILGKELSNSTVAMLLLQEQRSLNEDQWRMSLQQMKAIFDQFPETTKSMSKFRGSKNIPSYNASGRYAPITQSSTSSTTSMSVDTPQKDSQLQSSISNSHRQHSSAHIAQPPRRTTPPLLQSHQSPRHSSPRHSPQLQPSIVISNQLHSSAHIPQPPRKSTPPPRAKKNPGHGTMRMVKSRLKPGTASEKRSNTSTASPVSQPVAKDIQQQVQKDESTMIPIQSIEQSASTLPPDQGSPRLAMLSSRQFRRLQAPQIDRPIYGTEHAKRAGRQVSTSSTPDLRQSENTPDISASGQVANTMQAHIEEYKLSHLTLVKSLLRTQNNSSPRESQLEKVRYCSFDKVAGIPLIAAKGTASTQFTTLVDKYDSKSCKTYSSQGHELPFFSIYAPIRASYLTPNQERLNTVPWINLGDNGDGFEEEIREAYKLEDDDQRERNTIAKQHAVQIAPILAKALKTLDLDERQMLKYLIDYQLNTAWIPDDVKSYVIRDGQIRSKWSTMLRQVAQLSTSEVERANDVCQAFYSHERRSIWYLIRHLFKEARLSEPEALSSAPPDYSSSRCRICHTFHCLLHGELVGSLEDVQVDVEAPHGDEGAADGYSDDENPATINYQLAFRPRFLGTADSMHIAYRWPKQQLSLPVESRDLMLFPGAEESVDSEDTYAGCSNTCFWLKQNRVPFPDTDWTAAEQADLRQLLSSYGSSDRASCYISRIMGKSCVATFFETLRAAETLPEPKKKIQRAPPLGKPWYLTKEPTKAESREPFRPCNHEGPCDADCSCVQEEVPCEKTCACFPACDHRFRGCRCKRTGKICWQNKYCDCFRFGRECDEDLCGTCGADEALDPLNRYKKLDRVCDNVSIQRGITKKTLTGKSEVIGFGLFAAESMKAGDFISEYVGQTITEEESSRRGQVYHRRSVFYEYTMGSKRVTDGTTAGNKSRLMNHTHNPRRINVTSKLLICNGIVRLGFFAVRNLEPGTELVYDYGVDDSKTKEWMEKIDGQLVPMQPRKLGKVMRIKVQKKSKKQEAGVAGVGHSISDAAFAAFAASDDDDSSSDSDDEDPMELDIGPVRVDDSADDDYAEADSDDADSNVRRRSARKARAGTRSRATSPTSKKTSESSEAEKQSPHNSRKSPSNPVQREIDRLRATPWALGSAELQNAFGQGSASNMSLLTTLRDQATTHARHIEFRQFLKLAVVEHERRCANTTRASWTPGDLVKAGEAAFGLRGPSRVRGVKRKRGQSVGSMFDDDDDDDHDDEDDD